MKNINTKLFSYPGLSILLAVFCFGLFGQVKNVGAQYYNNYNVVCEFTRTLQVGSVGEDVRCLQRFLNSQGFIISNYGLGAPGSESTFFGQLTKNALIRWQTANNLYNNGVFNSSSISFYLRVVGVSTGYQNYTGNYYPTGQNYNLSSNQEIRSLLEEIRDLFDDFFDEIDNASDREIDDSRDPVGDAKDELLNSFIAFISGDFNRSLNSVSEARDFLEDAVDEIGGRRSGSNSGDREDARDAIDDAERAIDFAEDEIRYARDRGRSVSRAERLLDDARDELDEAEEAYDDRDYDEAIDRARDAEELADDAVREL